MTYAVDHYTHANGPGLTLGAVRVFPTRNDQLEQLDRLAGHWRQCGYAVTFPAAGLTIARDCDGIVRGVALARDPAAHDPLAVHSIGALTRNPEPWRILHQLRGLAIDDRARR